MRGFPWGGSEELWSRAALILQERGIQTAACFSYSPEAPGIRRLIEKGGKVFPAEQTSFFGRAKRKILGKKRSYPILDEFKPDLAVISQGTNLDGMLWMKSCEALRIPFVTAAQSASASKTWQTDEELSEISASYRKALACYFVSRENLECARMQLSAELPQAEVVWNPFLVNFNEVFSWPDKENPFKLACVGRFFIQDKGQDILLKVLSLEKWRSRPLQVTLFGSGPQRRMIENYIQNLKLKNVSSEKEMHPGKIWETQHALILPSRSEGSPLVLIEAMLKGRPAIASAVGGVSEILEDGVTGFLAHGAEVNCLDQAMERAWEARSEWRKIGETAYRKIRQAVPESPESVFADKLMRHLK